MIKANTTIIAGGKTFQAGQTVSGLSKLDKKWMLEAGYITETAGKKEEKGRSGSKETETSAKNDEKEQPAQEREKADG